MSVEDIKRASRQLRGTLAEDLADDTDHFAPDNTHLLKFHGIYQQDDRDLRRARAAKQLPLAYSCMVRTSVPGGVLEADQWLAMDRLTDELSDGTMRITTRQGVQFHFVAKDGLRPLIRTLNDHLVSTKGACGDVVRNVAACPARHHAHGGAELLDAARTIAARFRPHSGAYWELWVDGEQAVSAVEADPTDGAGLVEEPVYGDVYLPRKFKIGLAWPGDNCVDVYSQDCGLVAHDGGWVVLVGGGLGMSHAREDDTYPRLATPLAWVPTEQLGAVVEAIVTTQRDFGNRADRHRARLKYTIDERGVEWFRDEVERRVGVALAPAPPLPAWRDSEQHLGWSEEHDGRWTVGVHIPSGRVRDADGIGRRSALRELVERYRPEVRLTARQDVLLCGFAAADRAEVDAVLRRHGVPLADELRAVERVAIACPALPTCGQALGEAERVLPRFVDDLHAVLVANGLGDETVRMNVTGCPNGCARPYTAELGIVGRTKNTYDVYVGGAPGGDRLARRVARDVRTDAVAATVAPLVERYRTHAGQGESFGDFWDRTGIETLVELVPKPTGRRRAKAAGT